MELSLAELNMIIEAHSEIQEKQLKITAIQNYQLANLISIDVSCRLNGEEVPTLEQVFPNLFNEPQQEKEEVDWAAIRLKEQLLDFAEQHNKQRKG